MWWRVNEKPETEGICIVAVMGNINLIRDIARYDIDGDFWENLRGEKIIPVYWSDNQIPTIPDEFYNFIT